MLNLRVVEAGKDDLSFIDDRGTIRRDPQLERIVAEIIEDVRTRGDEALLESARKFDAPGLSSIQVTAQELEEAALERKEFEALRFALHRVRTFHLHQLEVILDGWFDEFGNSPSTHGMADVLELREPRKPIEVHWAISKRPSNKFDRMPRSGDLGVGQRMRSINAGGVYVPGGNAAYPSSVLMNAIPATVAMVPRIAVTTPARKDGTLPPAVLVALREVGVDQAFKVGGAAAIAALALGTESVQRVDKIVGPGNKFVNEAKRQLWGAVGLDGYAGSSEVCVFFDGTQNARFAAADLLTQIEHAPDNVGFLVAVGTEALQAVLAELELQLTGAPREASMREALETVGCAIVVPDFETGCEVCNRIAPEHLSLAVKDPEKALERIANAGCILVGEWTPESAGDYVLGPSHTLPTAGAARWQAPVSVAEFLKLQSVVQASPEDMRELGPAIEALATLEGFPAHANGATVRLDAIRDR